MRGRSRRREMQCASERRTQTGDGRGRKFSTLLFFPLCGSGRRRERQIQEEERHHKHSNNTGVYHEPTCVLRCAEHDDDGLENAQPLSLQKMSSVPNKSSMRNPHTAWDWRGAVLSAGFGKFSQSTDTEQAGLESVPDSAESEWQARALKSAAEANRTSDRLGMARWFTHLLALLLLPLLPLLLHASAARPQASGAISDLTAHVSRCSSHRHTAASSQQE